MAISLPTPSTNTGTNDWQDVFNNDDALVTEFDARDDNYQTILSGSGNYPASTSGTRYFTAVGNLTDGPKLTGSAQTGVGLALIYFDDADYTIASKTQKLRIRAQQATIGTGPGTTLTVGLYGVTAISGGVFTVATVTTGSTVAFASTAANTLAQANSGDFTIPADGYYIVGVANSGTTAGSSAHDLHFQLQTRWV